jgi:hypothetical protein
LPNSDKLLSGNLLSSSTAACRREPAPYPKEAGSADSRCGSCGPALYAEMALGFTAVLADSTYAIAGAKASAGYSRSVGRQPAESSSRSPCCSDLMATTATGTDFLRQVYSGDRQSPVWPPAAMALGCSAYTGTGPIREIYPAGGSCYRQSAVWDAPRLALGHAWPVASHAADADSLQQDRSRVCRSGSGKSPVRSGLAMGDLKPMASGFSDHSGKKAVSWHTRAVGRPAAVNKQSTCRVHHSGQGMGTVCNSSPASNLPAAACCHSDRQSAVWYAPRLALFGPNCLMAARKSAPQGVAEDFTRRGSASNRNRTERKTEVEAQ